MSSSYRAIALSCIFGKILDKSLLQNNVTGNLQLSFKSSSSTVMCSIMVTETIVYYAINNPSVYLLLIDTSKAFDRWLHHEALFQILKQKGICRLISRIFFNMHTHSTMKVRWNETYSESFLLQNGVKQGNCLSPILFKIYIDWLLERLKNAAIGLSYGRVLSDMRTM